MSAATADATPGPISFDDWVPSFNPWLIAVAVMLATFMEVLDTSVANVSLPHIAGNLSASTDEATWVLTSYLVSNAIVLPMTGWLSSVFGRRRLLVTCISIFTISSFMCGAATSLTMLIVARVVQGAGGGVLQPIAQATMLESFPREKRGVAMAVYGMGIVVAPIIGPTLGGWITDNYTWRWVFYINIPVGIVAVLMARAFIEDPPYMRRASSLRIDYVGFGLMAIGLATLQIMLDKGQTEDWFSSHLIVWLTVTSIVTLVAFVIWELITDEPLVDLRVLSNRNFAVGTMLIAVLGVVLYGTTALLPLFLQTLLGYPATQSGLAVSPRGFGSIVAMIIVARIMGKVDARYLMAFGFALLALSGWMLTRINLDISTSSVVWPNIINGFSMGFIFVPLSTIAMGTLRNEQIGSASGLYNLLRNLGGGVGISIMTTILARQTQFHQAILATHVSPYDPAFMQMMQMLQRGLSSRLGTLQAQMGAYGTVYGMVLRQASLLGFIDVFRILGILSLVCVPFVFVLKKVKARGGAMGGH
jgi:MFS transporter, DHA2 family, multidrug resistance protein